MRTVGLDLSLVSTGIVAYSSKRDKVIHHENPKTLPRMGSNEQRIAFIADTIDGIVNTIHPRVVVIEAPAYSPIQKSQMIQLGELAGVVKDHLFRLDQFFITVHNNTLKKFATGNGRAAKPAMVEAALAAWPECPLIHDLADAFFLARFGWAYAEGHVKL